MITMIVIIIIVSVIIAVVIVTTTVISVNIVNLEVQIPSKFSTHLLDYIRVVLFCPRTRTEAPREQGEVMGRSLLVVARACVCLT